MNLETNKLHFVNSFVPDGGLHIFLQNNYKDGLLQDCSISSALDTAVLYWVINSLLKPPTCIPVNPAQKVIFLAGIIKPSLCKVTFFLVFFVSKVTWAAWRAPVWDV